MAPKKNYSIEQMNQAIEDVGRDIPIATAARNNGVPRITLYYKCSEKVQKSVKWDQRPS